MVDKVVIYIKKNKLLIAILVAAFLLRVYFLYENLFFGWEQGRDFLKIIDILKGDIVLVGPKTDIGGVFHGALSYYLLIPFYLVSLGNPYIVQVLLIFVNVFSIVFLFELAKDMFNKSVALISSFLLAVSYSSIIYSRWLIHVNLAPAIAIAAIYFLYKTKRDSKNILLFALFWGIAFHLALQMSLIILLLLIPFLFLVKIRPKRKDIIFSLIILFFFASPFLFFDIKNQGITRNAVVNYLSEEKETITRSSTFDEFRNEVVDNVFPTNRNMAEIIVITSMVIVLGVSKYRKNSKLVVLLVLIVPLTFYVAGFKPLRHFYIYMPHFLALLLGLAIYSVYRSKYKVVSFLIVAAISISNFYTVLERLPGSKANFIHHSQRTYLKDEISLIDFVYTEANGDNFSYNYYSIPYWKEEAWVYLFDWYGSRKYSYLPTDKDTSTFYVVYEPDESQPVYQENWYKGLNNRSKLIKTHKSGKLTAEKRERL